MTNSNTGDRLRSIGANLALALAWYLGGWLGLQLDELVSGSVAMVWPPTGIAIAALIRGGLRRWPGVALGSIALAWTTGFASLAAAGAVLANVIEPVVAVVLLRRWTRMRLCFDRVRESLAYVGVAVVLAPTFSATLGTLALTFGGESLSSDFVADWTHWWLANAMSALLLAPALLTLTGSCNGIWSRPKRIELGLVLLTAIALAGPAFGGLELGPWTERGMSFAMFPLIVWTALRLGPQGAAITSLLIALITIWGTANGRSPFQTGSALEDMVLLQLYLAVVGLTSLILGAAVSERERAQADLDQRQTLLRELLEGAMRTEAALRQAEARYRGFFQESLAGHFVTAPDGRFLACNSVFARIFGFDGVEQVLAANANDLYPDPRIREAMLDRLRRERQLRELEVELRGRDGRLVQVVENIAGDFDPAGRLIELRGNLFDVTERRVLEQQLRQAQKMEAIGRLAGGIAHDFNNLLTAINGYADLLLARLRPTDAHRREVAEIRKAGDRAAALTRQLLAFSRQQAMRSRVVDLNTLISDSQSMLQRLIGEDIELVTELGQGLGMVQVDPNQVQQIILNLAINARDAMPGGGRLTITTGAVSRQAQASGPPPGSYVRLTIRDTGHGMDDSTKAKIFDPFFTTKEPGKGTGLGLSTVYGIVQQSGGAIEVDSGPGLGTAFKVDLPQILGERAAEPSVVEAPPAPAGATESILLVEDDAAVRELVRQILQEEGYRLLLAADAQEATRFLESEVGVLDLMITDLILPGIQGPELARAALALRPELRILFISGYPGRAKAWLAKFPQANFLEKPFTPNTLLHKVRSVLHPPEEAAV